MLFENSSKKVRRLDLSCCNKPYNARSLKLFACVFIRTPSPFLSLTLRSALLWGAKAPVVANIAYYAMSLLSNRESILQLF